MNKFILRTSFILYDDKIASLMKEQFKRLITVCSIKDERLENFNDLIRLDNIKSSLEVIFKENGKTKVGFKNKCPEFFELQIKTLYEHAWAEANHDLSYKSEEKLSRLQKRKVAFSAAQTWGAGIVFSELFKELGV